MNEALPASFIIMPPGCFFHKEVFPPPIGKNEPTLEMTLIKVFGMRGINVNYISVTTYLPSADQVV